MVSHTRLAGHPGETQPRLYQGDAPRAIGLVIFPTAAAVQIYALTDFHVKNAVALERLRTEFKGKVEILQYPGLMLREL